MVATARSFLFVPADNPRRLARAWQEGAGAVIADLEDGVVDGSKPAAREALEHQLAAGPPRGSLCVRVNGLDGPHAAADLELVRRLGDAVDAVVVPKASSTTLARAELGVPVLALVETAAGILEARAIASCAGVERLMLGTVDLAAELDVEIDPESASLAAARAALALASAAGGKPGPVDGVWAAVDDEAGLRREARAARAAGFTGKACIHPAQLAAVVEELSPTAEQVAHARRVVAAAKDALAAGQGAFAVDGRMVDKPVLARAWRTLNRAEVRA